MAEAKKTEYTDVTLTDGRISKFAGKRKVNKETVIDESKIELDEEAGILQISAGAVSVRMDFRNGDTRTIPLPLKLISRFAGHGGEQKFGDELASPADKPLSEEDMVVAIDDLNAVIQKGDWGRTRESSGGAVSGAHFVVQALIESTTPARAAAGKPPLTVEQVKDYLQKRLDGDKDLTRKALYDSFRVASTETGKIIKRLEEAKLEKTAKVDANAAAEEAAAMA
tara:strand:+ start:963 stop:1637 length:675 start_codon:yes stop_codon:yes gene_type:complete